MSNIDFTSLQVSVLKSESPTPTEISVEDDGHTSAHISLNEDLQSNKSDKKSPGRSTNYSDDFSGDFGNKVKETGRDLSESSDSQATPEIVLKDNSLDVLARKQVLTAVAADKEKSKESFLSDLPPLGNVGKSSLSDLPPLNAGRTLAPLSKIPPKNIDSGLETKTEGKKTSLGPKKKVESQSVPTFGFESDHVISEKSQSSRNQAGKVKSPEPNSEVTENIEEELDSFLNSEVSDDITRDETIQEGESLKADYVASL